MNEYLSRKIKFLSFFAISGVVYCHAYNYADRFLQSRTVLTEGANPGTMLQFFISNGLVRFAVPLFFTFSAYLFFVNFEFNWKGYLKKVLKRVRTLMVPFLIWTALAGAFLYIVYKVTGLERYSIVYEKVGTMLENGVWVWLFNSPAFQLWYLTDLFKLVLISPVIYWLVKKCKLVPVILFGILWVLEWSFFINYEGLFFFTIGAYLAVNKKTFVGMISLDESYVDKEKNKSVTKVITVLWVAGCFGYALMSGTMGESAYVTYLLLGLYKVNVITGLVSVWRLYDIKTGTWQDKKWVNEVVSCTVIVFVAHEPLQHLLTDVLLEIMVFNGAHTLIYFVLPMVIMLACVGFGIFMKKAFPKVYGVLTGGRI